MRLFKLVPMILAGIVLAFGPGKHQTFTPEEFKLPSEAQLLVVVEADSKETCKVYAYEKENAGDEKWKLSFAGPGNIGRGGMSYNRTMGDGSSPIGVWMLNTPFGQAPALEGFPKNYVQVDSTYVWEDATNTLTLDPDRKITGEHVGTSDYAKYYDYVLDAGFNKKCVDKKGSALFIHCQGDKPATSSGCIKISKENMIKLMQLYGKYGDGKCFIAQGIAGEMDCLYDAYGTNNGLEATKK